MQNTVFSEISQQHHIKMSQTHAQHRRLSIFKPLKLKLEPTKFKSCNAFTLLYFHGESNMFFLISLQLLNFSLNTKSHSLRLFITNYFLADTRIIASNPDSFVSKMKVLNGEREIQNKHVSLPSSWMPESTTGQGHVNYASPVAFQRIDWNI